MASPIINPVLFIMSFVLGWHIALVRVLSALALGSLAGTFYYFFLGLAKSQNKKYLIAPFKKLM